MSEEFLFLEGCVCVGGGVYSASKPKIAVSKENNLNSPQPGIYQQITELPRTSE